MQDRTSGASQQLFQFLGLVGPWVKAGTRMYPCAIEEPPCLALFPVLEGSFYIPGHDAHPTAGAFPSSVYKTHGRIIKLNNLHVPSVEEKVWGRTLGLSLDTELLSVVLFPIILGTSLVIKGQRFLKMGRWWMETTGYLLIYRIGEYDFSVWFLFVSRV